MNFEDRLTALGTLGVWCRHDEVSKIEAIHLPFTAEQMLDVCDKEGELLPTCCGNISTMRDLIMRTMHEGCWMDSGDLVDLIALMKGHDGFMDLFGAKDGDGNDPFLKLARAWPLLEGHLSDHSPITEADDPTDVLDMLKALSEHSYKAWFRHALRPHPQNPADFTTTPASEIHERNRKDAFEHAVNTTATLLQLAPALHRAHRSLTELYPGVVHGYCAVLTARKWGAEMKVSTDPFGFGIVATAGGMAVRETEAEVEELISLWENTRPGIRDRVVIKPVRVSAYDGIELRP